MKLKRRSNGTGSVVKLSGNRAKPYAARILIGYNNIGKPIYHDIETFEEDIDALVFLENYKKNPSPIKIKQEKYNKIAVFPSKPFPLVPVENITSSIHRKNKKNYTYKQVFEEMKENLFLMKKRKNLKKNII